MRAGGVISSSRPCPQIVMHLCNHCATNCQLYTQLINHGNNNDSGSDSDELAHELDSEGLPTAASNSANSQRYSSANSWGILQQKLRRKHKTRTAQLLPFPCETCRAHVDGVLRLQTRLLALRPKETSSPTISVSSSTVSTKSLVARIAGLVSIFFACVALVCHTAAMWMPVSTLNVVNNMTVPFISPIVLYSLCALSAPLLFVNPLTPLLNSSKSLFFNYNAFITRDADVAQMLFLALRLVTIYVLLILRSSFIVSIISGRTKSNDSAGTSDFSTPSHPVKNEESKFFLRKRSHSSALVETSEDILNSTDPELVNLEFAFANSLPTASLQKSQRIKLTKSSSSFFSSPSEPVTVTPQSILADMDTITEYYTTWMRRIRVLHALTVACGIVACWTRLWIWWNVNLSSLFWVLFCHAFSRGMGTVTSGLWRREWINWLKEDDDDNEDNEEGNNHASKGLLLFVVALLINIAFVGIYSAKYFVGVNAVDYYVTHKSEEMLRFTSDRLPAYAGSEFIRAFDVDLALLSVLCGNFLDFLGLLYLLGL
ncbi:hypothetical protein HK100_007986 [Physocladia obscura]|uniref:Uncharacterized protein n=1 Tax=Physocladia obscura TaxID=109957 RepID=A0AAD5SNN5_9FUNG|nr:hypothetical protein HK100_007986 [Physocladia obscura]